MNQKHNDLMKRITIRIRYKKQIGSGVFFEICGTHIILTAAHVLCNDSEIDINELSVERVYENQTQKIIITACVTVIDIQNDLAALQIETDAETEELLYGNPNVGDKAILSGYPIALQECKDTQWLSLSGEYKDVSSNTVLLRLDEKLDTYLKEEKDRIDGYSGGGVFSISQNQIWLNGIETNALTTDVAYNIIRCIPVQSIIDFLKTNYAVLNLSIDSIGQINTDMLSIMSSQYYNEHFAFVSDCSTTISLDKITDQYREGIDAQPIHIRYNLDIKREKQLQRISDCFHDLPIVILRGASGQGKTTLAYRYLIDTYGEQHVLVMKKIISESIISKVLSFMKSVDNAEKYILFYDVMPGDMYWDKFLKEAYNLGIGIKILVSIREEDFNTGSLNKYQIPYNDIHLWLSEEEARIIYSVYESKNRGCKKSS